MIIERHVTGPFEVSVTASEATSQAIQLGAHAGGAFVVTAASGTITLQWWVASGPNTAYRQMHSSTNEAITSTIAVNRAYPMPDEVFGAWGVKAVAASGTATLSFSFKS